MSQVSSDLSSNPGRILRAAREELNYTLAQVADELHLRNSIVEAMEKENYDEFSSDVFLKGYFRSYCRLVNLHEDRMIEFLDLQLADRKQQVDNEALKLRRKKHVRARNKVTIILVLASAIAGIGSFILGSVYDTNTETSANTNSNVTEKKSLTDSLPPQNEANEIVEQNTSESILVEEAKQVQTQDDSALKQTPDELAQEGLVVNTTLPAIDPKAASAESVAARPAVDANANTNGTIASDKLISGSTIEARFTGDCWFKLVDADNNTIFALLKRANEHVSYTGKAPFRVVLGDAGSVSLSFNGIEVDLNPYRESNGLASLTLGER